MNAGSVVNNLCSTRRDLCRKRQWEDSVDRQTGSASGAVAAMWACVDHNLNDNRRVRVRGE